MSSPKEQLSGAGKVLLAALYVAPVMAAAGMTVPDFLRYLDSQNSVYAGMPTREMEESGGRRVDVLTDVCRITGDTLSAVFEKAGLTAEGYAFTQAMGVDEDGGAECVLTLSGNGQSHVWDYSYASSIPYDFHGSRTEMMQEIIRALPPGSAKRLKEALAP